MSIVYGSTADPWVPLVNATTLTGFSGGPFMDAVVHAAGDSIRDECGWHISPKQTTTVRWHTPGSGSALILLPTLKLVDVVSVVDRDGNALTGFDWSENGVLSRSGGFPSWVEVTFLHGHGECPRALLGVVAERASALARGRVKSEALAGRSVSLEAGYDPASERVLAKYRLNHGA